MGFIRKALFIATGGLSGLVFKDNSKKKRVVKAAQKQRPKKPTKVTRPTARGAGRAKPQAARRARPQAARRAKPKAARRTPIAQTAGAVNGTAKELERLADLHGRGALTGEEFAAAKAKTLGTSMTSRE